MEIKAVCECGKEIAIKGDEQSGVYRCDCGLEYKYAKQ